MKIKVPIACSVIVLLAHAAVSAVSSIESLLRVVEGDGSAKAKESYEFVTGDEFTDRAVAEKWIAGEYESPETDKR